MSEIRAKAYPSTYPSNKTTVSPSGGVLLDKTGYVLVELMQFKYSGKWYTNHTVRVLSGNTTFDLRENLSTYISQNLSPGYYVSDDDILEFPYMYKHF